MTTRPLIQINGHPETQLPGSFEDAFNKLEWGMCFDEVLYLFDKNSRKLRSVTSVMPHPLYYLKLISVQPPVAPCIITEFYSRHDLM
jgi:hypothetical protein